jgi:hypothetical protein
MKQFLPLRADVCPFENLPEAKSGRWVAPLQRIEEYAGVLTLATKPPENIGKACQWRSGARWSPHLRRRDVVQLLQQVNGSLERIQFIRGHRVGIKMHHVVSDQPNFFEKRSQYTAIDLER